MREKFLVSLVSRCPYLGDGAKVTFLTLRGLCEPIVEITETELSMMRGKSTSAVQKHLKELRDLRYISIVAKKGPTATTSVYKCHPERVLTMMGFGGSVGKAISDNDTAIIKKAFIKLQEPNFLPDLTEAANTKKISLPRSNAIAKYLMKDKKDYLSNDILSYFRGEYKTKNNLTHRSGNRRDIELCKTMLREFSNCELCDIIDYIFSLDGNFKKFTFNIFYKNVHVYHKRFEATIPGNKRHQKSRGLEY